MNWIDWTIVSAFATVIMIAGLVLSKQAGKNMSNFFLAGRKLPWWLAGLSMVATNFGSDSPLHMAGRARTGGVGNFWFYLRGIFMRLSVAFVFAKLWRRANILTEVEFLELRHGSAGGRTLRFALAAFNSLAFAPFKIGLFTLAMSRILKVLIDIPETFTFLGLTLDAGVCLSIGMVLFALLYCTSSGFWGVIITDFFEAIVAFIGMYVLLILIYQNLGGPSGLSAALSKAAEEGLMPHKFTSFVPGDWWKSISFLLIFSPLFWFTDGEAATAQRLMACRSEKDAMLSEIFRTTANYVLRSWPWIITGLASIVILPQIDNPNEAYPAMIKEILPHGFIGLMLASFIAAFLSSTDSYLNLGTSFFVNDIYKRYLAKEKSERHYVKISRYATVFLAGYSILVAIFSTNIFGLFILLMKMLAGIHVIRVLRWFWWRVNAAAEITALVTAFTFAIGFEVWSKMFTAGSISIAAPPKLIMDAMGASGEVFSYEVACFIVEYTLITIIVSILSILVMFLIKPDPTSSLQEFYRRVRPAGPGWKPIAKLCPEVKITDSLTADLTAWFVGIIFVYSAVFASGGIFLAKWRLSIISGVIGLITAVLLWKLVMPRYEKIVELDREIEEERKTDETQ